MIKLDYIPDNWTKDQMKIYEIYCEYFADNKDGVDPQAIEELEKMLAR